MLTNTMRHLNEINPYPMQHRPLITVLCVIALLTACNRKQALPATSVDGAVRILSSTPLNKTAMLQLKLEDVSGTAEEIATTQIMIKALPYHFSLPYAADRIDRQHRYTMSARLYVNKQLLYATDTAYAVLTQGNGSYVDLYLSGTGSNSTGAAQALDPALLPASADQIVTGHLDTTEGRSEYRAGMVKERLAWLEEERAATATTQKKFHARYELNGGYLRRYSDNSPLEIDFDERGRPLSMTDHNEAKDIHKELARINAARNRAALLRSHALAARDTQKHRKETE